MGLFDIFKRKKSPPPTPPSSSGNSGNGPGGPGSGPKNSLIDQLFSNCDMVRVAGYEPFSDKTGTVTLYETADPAKIHAVRASIRVVEDGTAFLTPGIGSLWLHTLQGGEIVGVMNVYAGSVYSQGWDGHAFFEDKEAFKNFLRNEKVDLPPSNPEEWEAARKKWMAELEANWSAHLDAELLERAKHAVNGHLNGTGVFMELLQKKITDGNAQVQTLCRLYGGEPRSWNGRPGYENLARNSLNTFSATALFSAALRKKEDPQVLEGLARYVCHPRVQSTRGDVLRKIPKSLKERIAAHLEASGDSAKVTAFAAL